MADLDRLLAVKRAAEVRLRAIPGVHAVGIGAKIVGGNRTGGPAIAVFVVKKKAANDVASNEAIPAEIDGIKTDVIEMAIPTAMASFVDDSRHRPVPPGACVQAGASAERGSLGFFALTADTPAKVVAVTCQHVVAPPQAKNVTDLQINGLTGNASGATFSVGANNTPGTVVVARFGTKNTTPPTIVCNAYYKTNVGDTAETIAKNLVTAIMAMNNSNINAAPGANPESVDVSINPASNIQLLACSVFDPVIADSGCKLLAIVSNDGTGQTSSVALSGTVDKAYGIYVSWNTNGNNPTQGAFTTAVKGATLQDTASSIIGAINNVGAAGVKATPTATGFKLSVVAEVDCLITRDVRVGQPNDSFSSNCSLCCTNEIGKVIAANISLDIAVIQLVTGMQYINVAKQIGPLTGIQTTAAAVNDQVQKYGAATGFKTSTVENFAVTGRYATNQSDPPGQWEVFYRYYHEAILVTNTNSAFSDRGDSGCAVLNMAGQIVGILFASSDTVAAVTPIQSVLDAMKISFANATTAQTVTAAQGISAMVMLPPGLVADTLMEVRTELTATPEGKELTEVIERHAGEVQELANSNRRMATMWRRRGGPEMLQAIFNMAKSRDQRLPSEINGRPLEKCLRDMQRVLMRYGSIGLANDLSRYGSRLLVLAGLSYSELVAALQSQGES